MPENHARNGALQDFDARGVSVQWTKLDASVVTVRVMPPVLDSMPNIGYPKEPPEPTDMTTVLLSEIDPEEGATFVWPSGVDGFTELDGTWRVNGLGTPEIVRGVILVSIAKNP